MKKVVLVFLFFVNAVFIRQLVYAGKSPRFVVAIVIDQFAFHHIKRLAPYFTDGFKTFMKNGTYFENAFHPHGIPTTATGHTTISTGALPKDHGVILNNWMEDGKNVVFGKDNSPESAVFTKKVWVTMDIQQSN